jgi:hypothetical protein
MKTVFVSATGKYIQGNLTPKLFRDLCESYDPAIYEAGAFVAHSTKWADAGINEPPRLASVKSLSDSFIGSGGRVFLSTTIEPSADYEDAQQYFPHKSIEFWDATDPRNPLNQPHIPVDKQGRPYFRGYALLGDSPAAKLPAAITKFFGQLTDEKRVELAKYCDESAGLYCYKDTLTKIGNSMDYKKIAAALGLPETATEEEILAAINKKEPEGEPSGAEYKDKITELEAKIVTLEKGAGDGVKEYSDKLTAAETQLSTLRAELHTQKIAGMIQAAQAKNPTVGAEKLERIKTFADRDYKDGDDKYTLATTYLSDIPEVKPVSVTRVSGQTDTEIEAKLCTVHSFSDLAKDADLRNLFAEHRPEQYEKLINDTTVKI